MIDDGSRGWRAHPAAPGPGRALCALADIADGSARVVAFGRGFGALEIVIAREAHCVTAFVNVCPHQPLPLNIDARVATRAYHLVCDHHGATFRFRDGVATAGPCLGVSLEPVPITLRDETIVVAE